MILGMGVDVCPIERIEKILERQGGVFADRVFTQTELEYAGDGPVQMERLAARFAVKEATIKALGAPDGLRWKDMEIVNRPDGAPVLQLHGQAQECAKRMGAVRKLVSISHAGGIAVAFVVLEGE